LEANTQIRKVSVEGTICDKKDTPEDKPMEKILPILSSSFKDLTSLRLIWNKSMTIIPGTAIALISRMRTLEQLCLGSGKSIGWKYDWLIDHELIRNHMSNLPRLKKLAFQRDSYKFTTFLGYIDYERYYENRFTSREEMQAAGLNLFSQDDDSRVRVWEHDHKTRMTLEAQKYAELMPTLSWIYIGQYPMTVLKGNSGEVRRAVPQCATRDSCETLLNRMFGYGGIPSD
jgi:hypothetical protein